MIVAIRLFAAVVLVYALSSGTLPVPLRGGLGLVALLVGASTLAEAGARARGPLFAALAIMLGGAAVAYYEAVANHHFVLTYAAVVFALASTGREDDPESLQWGAARLLAALMGVAFLQKLAAPEYLDGSYFAYLIDIGALGWPGLTVCPSCEARVDVNSEAVFAFITEPPRPGEGLELSPVLGGSPVAVWWIARVLAGVVLVVELWLACVYLWAPTSRWAGRTLVVFATGLALMRAECVFGSLVCVLGIAAAGETERWERTALIGIWMSFMGLLFVAKA